MMFLWVDFLALMDCLYLNTFSFFLRRSGTDNVNVQQNMLNHLGDGCFYLQDFEMDLVEIPYLVKFLQSKTVSVVTFSGLPFSCAHYCASSN